MGSEETDKTQSRQRTGSFVRWQTITVNQVGYAVRLILSLATASLGFCLTLIRSWEFHSGCLAALTVACLLLVGSITLGGWCVINRLRDFRKTARIARIREELEAKCVGEGTIRRKLLNLRLETQKLGKATWRLFCFQTATFASSLVVLISTVGIDYGLKLFEQGAYTITGGVFRLNSGNATELARGAMVRVFAADKIAKEPRFPEFLIGVLSLQ